MTNLPVPRFRIGDVIFVPGTTDGREEQPCPDCLGAGVWPTTSPAGEEHSVRCPTCHQSGNISFYRIVPTTRRLTVGSVRIDTAADDGERVSYMCVETGVGSGNVYYEKRCYPDATSALAESTIMAEEQTRRIRENNQKHDELRVMTIKSAAETQARNRAIAAECALENLKRRVIELGDSGYLFLTAEGPELREVSLYLVPADDPMRAE